MSPEGVSLSVALTADAHPWEWVTKKFIFLSAQSILYMEVMIKFQSKVQNDIKGILTIVKKIIILLHNKEAIRS